MEIRIAAALVMRSDGATLLVRKRGTSAFMQPGGKIDGAEAPIDALRRELLEEVGLSIAPEDAEYLGCFSAPAAYEAGCTVSADLFRLASDAPVEARSEIAEARWIRGEAALDLPLAPLTRDVVLSLIARGDQAVSAREAGRVAVNVSSSA
ncbi:NUDIX domain-containing protein [Aureimonas sp. ME7]|uniref:NUDIX hydrolase n=1 Tax=Aureimonas sp. ME7 TaxID=2744252 RepID=UPI0015F38540|nr:NUDIX domain-containing protein [Aureimonas sp. ME7]